MNMEGDYNFFYSTEIQVQRQTNSIIGIHLCHKGITMTTKNPGKPPKLTLYVLQQGVLCLSD